MEVRFERVEPMRVAFVHHVGPYDECSKAWDRITVELGRKGLLGADTKLIGLIHDDPEGTDPEDLVTDIYALLESG